MTLENRSTILKNFISKEESTLIVEWVSSLEHVEETPNHHLAELSKNLLGKSCIFDISNTPYTNYITNFQAISKVSREKLPQFIQEIIIRIAERLVIPMDHVFLQAVSMESGGKIDPHYDSSIEGYINYKCNICAESEDYQLFIDGEALDIQAGDMYCFEASLYKHWTHEFRSRRVFLSIGFLLPYEVLGRSVDDPRVRLSNRIARYFQK